LFAKFGVEIFEENISPKVFNAQVKGAQTVNKSGSHIKILGAGSMPGSKFPNEDPKILGLTA
jgi:hypothetical protein